MIVDYVLSIVDYNFTLVDYDFIIVDCDFTFWDYIQVEYFHVSQQNNISFHSDCKDG